MFKCYWKISTFIKFTKSRWFAITNTCCFCWWWCIYLTWYWFFFKEYQFWKVRINTLAFFKRDFTVKPSVTKGPVCLNRALVSRRGDAAVAIICCWVLESVSILHKWHTLSFFSLYCLLTTTIKKNLLPRNNPPSFSYNSYFILIYKTTSFI